MASFKNTLKHALFEYPTIFPNPADVCIHLFCVIGNGYAWHKGQLVDRYSKTSKNFKNLKMKYPFKEESDFDKKFAALKCLSHIRTERKLENEARLIQMQFVEKHIDEIINASPVATYFSGSRSRSYFTKGTCIEYAKAFHFPDDIKKDWAKALYKFLEHWLYSLNAEYGIGDSKEHDNFSHWPTDAKEARKAIWDTRIRLHPIVHNGQTYAEHAMKMHEMFKGFNQ